MNTVGKHLIEYDSAFNSFSVDAKTHVPYNTELTRPLVVALVPAYNEERFIGSVVLATRKYADAVIVVDDGSHDKTAELAILAGAIVVKHETNQGKGMALNTGFLKARELFLPAVIVTLDGDWQHNPEELPRITEPILANRADLVIGSRYLQKTSKVPLQRVIGHAGFTALVNTLSGTELTDSQSGFRAFSLQAINHLNFNSAGFSVESEMQFLATKHQLRVCEVPITIRYIDKPKRPVLKHGLTVLHGILQLMGQHRPLLFFGLAGFITLIIGLTLGYLVIESYNSGYPLPLWELAVAVFLWINGTLMLLVGIILHSLRGLILEFVRPAKSA